MDIGTEELSHLEIVGTLARMHLKPTKKSRDSAEADPLIAIAGGRGGGLFNSMGDAWTADYLKITGELDVDLRSNIAAKARALTIPPAWEMKEKVMLAVLGTRAASGESLNPQNFNRESRHRAERRQPGMQSPWPKRLERPE